MPIDSARRKLLLAKAPKHLEAAYVCMDESEDATACYLIGSAMDEIKNQEIATPRDEKVIPLVPRK